VPQAGFAVGLDAAEDSLKSTPADTYSRRFGAF